MKSATAVRQDPALEVTLLAQSGSMKRGMGSPSGSASRTRASQPPSAPGRVGRRRSSRAVAAGKPGWKNPRPARGHRPALNLVEGRVWPCRTL